jgi:mono/diheme cytochrome c family protein
MKRAYALTIGLVSGCILIPIGVATAQSAELPDGPGKAFAAENCGACHGLELVTAQRRSRDEWEEVLNRMIANGDSLTEDQYNEVLVYLATYLGTEPALGAVSTSSHVTSE